jgi:hypothetical protein
MEGSSHFLFQVNGRTQHSHQDNKGSQIPARDLNLRHKEQKPGVLPFPGRLVLNHIQHY